MALIAPVRTLEEGIEKANSLPFGLAAYAFTHSARNVDLLTDGVECGNLSINTLEASVAETPFGGVKESGYGREGGAEGLHHYMIVKNVSQTLAHLERATTAGVEASTAAVTAHVAALEQGGVSEVAAVAAELSAGTRR